MLAPSVLTPSTLNPPADQVQPKMHWSEIATLVSAAALIVVSIICFALSSALPHLGVAPQIVAYCSSGIAITTILGYFIHKVFCSTKPVQEEPESLPEKPLKERLGVKQGAALKHTDPHYSNKRTASEKLDIQLDYAVRQGLKDQKKRQYTPFSVQNHLSTWTTRSLPNVNLPTEVGLEALQGRRPEMEDAHLGITLKFKDQEMHLIGVFDGHGDKGKASTYVSEALPGLLEQKLSQAEKLDDETVANSFTAVFQQIENDLIAKQLGGTTATCVLIMDDKIYAANSGDSRSVLVRPDKAFQLTEDAEPSSNRFLHGIEKMGNTVFGNRVNGQLAVARDLGLEYASSRPKISRIYENIEDDLQNMKIGYKKGDYLVIACDGLWDVATVSEVREAIWKMKQENMMPVAMSSILAQEAIDSGSTDNVSVVVVKL